MFYLLTSIFLVCFHIFLNFTSPINIFPELFVYPWLISKGLIPYRDFFDHHGPLLYYLLAPFSGKKDLSLIFYFFQLIQISNLMLVLYILKKQTSRLFFILCGLLYVALNYYFTDNNFWFEQLFAVLSLFLYILTYILKKGRYSNIGIAFILFLVFLIKPTFLLISIPVILFTKNIYIVRYLLLFLVIFFLFLFVNGLLYTYLDLIFMFNFKAISFIRSYYFFTIDQLMFNSIALISLVLSIFLIREKKYYSFLLFLGIQFGFVLQGYTKTNFTPYIPFFIVLISIVTKKIPKNVRFIFVCFLIFLYVITYQKVKHFFVLSKQNIPYIKNPLIQTCMQSIHKNGFTHSKNIYYDSPEFYYLLDYKPPFYYLFYLDFITKKRSDFESKTISDIQKNKVIYLALKNENKSKYKHLQTLNDFFGKNFRKISTDTCFTYYQKK